MRNTLLILSICSLAVLGCRKKEEAAPPQPAKATTVAATPAVTPQATVTLASGAPIPATGVALWLVADDAKPAADGKLASWTSAAVAGATAAAEKPKAQPILVPNALNGHAVVRFDGESNLLMTSIDISADRMPEATVFAVFSSKTAAPSPLRKLYGDDNGGYDRAAGLDNRGGREKNYGVFTGRGVSGYFALTADETYVTSDQFTRSDFSGWVNGKQELSKVAAAWGKSLPNLYIGGSGTSFHEAWQGDLAEMIVYGRLLTDQERMQVEDYLGRKYAVALKR